MAFWWSEDQMEGLDLDSPPPKEERIELSEWSASDPVGTPHPETIDVVVEISNNDIYESGRVDIQQRWKVGPLSSPAEASWEDWDGTSAKTEITEQDANVRVVYSVDIKEKLDRHYKHGQWAYGFEVLSSVHDASAPDSPIVKRQVLLINPGD